MKYKNIYDLLIAYESVASTFVLGDLTELVDGERTCGDKGDDERSECATDDDDDLDLFAELDLFALF